jgi:elongation factor P--(R)-beta-lysine ligase
MLWRPSACLDHLHVRAQILKKIRHFFDEKQVMEVETPLMCHTSVTDPFINSIPALFQAHSKQTKQYYYYLQTSPEYAMKRLLAAGCGSIYQITKAFRQGEIGPIHNPEFTMLEWYRIGFDHWQLMDEVDELLQVILEKGAAERKTYAALFEEFLHINPHSSTVEELMKCAAQNNISHAMVNEEKDTWLDFLLTHCIEPYLGKNKPCFIYDFPASQAALAKTRLDSKGVKVACRFEVYVAGMELANGFHELQDANEQRARFEKNNRQRQQLGLAEIPLDEFLLAALTHGLPDCAGVALGIDRLILLATKAYQLADVLSFEFKRA